MHTFFLGGKYEKKFKRETQKARLEYDALFRMITVSGRYNEMRIIKQIQPDFVLEAGNEKIGVEVTEFTTPQDKVMNVISKKNFGMGKTIDVIKKDAIKEHGSKASEYEYFQLDATNVVGRPMFNVVEQHKWYAREVVKKFEIYKGSFAQYSEFVILCDGQHSMCLSSKYDSEAILLLARDIKPSMQGFILNVLRQDDFGKCVLDTFEV